MWIICGSLAAPVKKQVMVTISIRECQKVEANDQQKEYNLLEQLFSDPIAIRGFIHPDSMNI